MSNQTDLLNIALGKVGARRINAIDDGSENANLCQTFYPSVLDGALRVAHWNFATTRATLALLADAPLFDYQFAYALPTDFIKLQEYYDSLVLPVDLVFIDWRDFNYSRYFAMFRIETYVPSGAPPDSPPVKILVSRGEKVQIVYTRRIENPDLWNGDFFWYVACWLASELANAIAHNPKVAAQLKQESMMYLSLAAATDGQERSIEPFVVPDLIWGR